MHEASDSLESAAAVGDFVEMWTSDQRRGQVKPLADYLARFPGFETRIAREYCALVEPAESMSAPVAADGERHGAYRPIRLLGQGGQGAVWLAEDTRLGRHVALKVLSASLAEMSSARVERLRREAQTLARLDHPCICPVYEADLDGRRPYLAMRFVDGETLASVIAQRNAPLSRPAIQPWLPFFALVAEALHAAHELGIVHRDVKPGNLMRTSDGAPVVLDFGLARDLESTNVSLTQSGEMFGTLPYMAPEVLLGRGSDRRADVYALGVVLYETIANRRPFAGATHAALRRAIETGEAAPLTELASAAGPDLGLVVATALERDPDRRYLTARAFADDLRRVAAGRPIAARPVGAPVRLRRALARHPVVATSMALVVAGLVVALVLLAEVERGRAKELALRRAYQAQAMVAGDPGTALNLVTAAALAEPHPEINDILFQVLDGCWEEHAVVRTTEELGTDSAWVETSPDDRYVLNAAGNGAVRLVDTATGRIASAFRHAPRGPTTGAFCDSGRLLTGGVDGRVRMFDVHSGALLRTIDPADGVGGDALVTRIVVARDRRRAALARVDGLVAIIDIDGGGTTRCLGHEGCVDMLAFDPSGTRILTCGGDLTKEGRGDHTVRVFDAGTGAALQKWGPFPGPVHWIEWSSDGTNVALSRDERRADVCDVATGRTIASLPHGGEVYWAAFAAAGRQLVTGSLDGLGVFDIGSQVRIRNHANFEGRSVFRGAFSPDGSRLGVIAWNETAHIFETANWDELRVLHGVTARALGVCWNHAGTRLATEGFGLQTWYVDERPHLPRLRGNGRGTVSAEFTRDGEHVVTANSDGEIRLWDTARNTTTTLLPAGVPVRRALLSPDGRTALVLAVDAPPFLLGLDGARRQLGGTPAGDAWFLRDGSLALGGADGVVRICDVLTGRETGAVRCHEGPIQCGALHPGKAWLATGSNDRSFCIVDLAQLRVVFHQQVWQAEAAGDRGHVFGLAFDQQGDRLFGSCEDCRVRVLDLARGAVCRAVVCGPTPGRLVMNRGGDKMFIAGQWGGRLMYCAVGRGEEAIYAGSGHKNLFVALELQSRGDLALSASTDGTVHVHDSRTGRLLSEIHASSSGLRDAHFSPDGTRIVTAAADGEVRIWPTDPLATAVRHCPSRPGETKDR